MIVTQQAVRVYASAAYTDEHNTPRLDLLGGQPVEITPYLLDGSGAYGRAKVYLGAPVPAIVEGSLIRQAIGYKLLEWFTGQPLRGDPERMIDDGLAEIDATKQWQADWYLTIIVEQDVEISDEHSVDNKYVWFVDDTYERGRSFLDVASPHIDRIATLAATVLAPQTFGDVALTDRVFFSAPGRKTFSLPESNLSANGQVRTLVQYLDLSNLNSRLQASSQLSDETTETVKAVTFWWLSGLKEKDLWRAFMLFFIGFELLHGRMGRRCYDRAVTCPYMQGSDQVTREMTPVLNALLSKKKATVGQVIPKGQLDESDAAEFAAMALALLPARADADFDTFSRMKTLRNSVTHGKRRINEVTFPVHELRDLLGVYIGAVVNDDIVACKAASS